MKPIAESTNGEEFVTEIYTSEELFRQALSTLTEAVDTNVLIDLYELHEQAVIEAIENDLVS